MLNQQISSNIKFKFAHLADCHIGGWREQELKELSILSFKKAIEVIIEKQVNFLIIAGDLFNTAIPQIDALKQVALSLRKLKENNIPAYIIAGSHDFSPSGKTMLDVLENAGLCKNVSKYNEEEKTLKTTNHFLKNNEKITLTGISGLTGGLERVKYQELSNKQEIESINNFKIFLFHTLLTELKPQTKDWEKVPSESLSLLPKNFNYYSGGHPHFKHEKSTETHPLITYPGPLFPNNFKELEELKHGGFYIVNVDQNNSITLNHIPISLKETISINLNADEKSPEEIEREITQNLSQQEINEKIITIRIKGTLKTGKPSDIDFRKIINNHPQAHIILKNTSKLKTKEFSEIKVSEGTIEQVEQEIIKNNINQLEIPDLQLNQHQEILTEQLMTCLNKEKQEGEKNIDFESRVTKDIIEIFNLKEIFN
jgi:DNA repair protein SbcD/Mre11